VLEGNVRRRGDTIRVNVQLIDATTRAHAWAEGYEKEAGDAFAIQDELRAAIVAALQPELRRAEAEHARRSAPGELTAWSLVNRAWVSVQSDLGSRDVALAAAASCESALTLDPDYALAHAVLGHARSLVAAEEEDPRAAREEALSFARRGVALGVDDPLVQHCYAATMGNLGRTREGILAFERSLELDPNSAQALAGLGIAQIFVGRPEEALRNIDAATRLSPRDPLRYHWIAHRAMACMLLARFEEAVASARDSVARTDSRIGWATLATCLGKLGELEEGRRAVLQLQRVAPEIGIEEWGELLASVTSGDEQANALCEGLVASVGDLA
jgi:tetratricopeptide (TPR) repeat protein